jgi:putative ABC transport system permease protein
MSDLSLILSSLKARWLNVTLSVFLTAFGVMLAVLIIQFGNHIQNRLSADGRGIDIVVGAKGSPLQLILSSVYHIDIPTGNMPYDEAKKWMKHRHVKTAIPLALGDNWKGKRIVGTTPAYMQHYNAELAQGRMWDKAFEAVAGASVGLERGDEFAGAHGLTAGGHAHEEERYKITGVMKPTGTVLDRLILTSLDSVLKLHGQEGIAHNDHAKHEHKHHHDHEGHDNHSEEKAGEPEITALLLTTASPIANINLPRSINRESNLQAANPALEMMRLTSMLGLGTQSFAALSSLLIIIAALSIFSGLAGSLENRMGDLAVLRAIGYSKRRVFKIITLEGMTIVTSGLALGIIMGVTGFSTLTRIVTPLQASGASISFTADFILIVLAVLFAGLIAAAFPALRAARIAVAQQLSQNA